MASFEGPVRKAFQSQETLLGRGEHCSLDPERLASIAMVTGSQVRVTRGVQDYAVYTVSETRQEPDDRTVRMALEGRQRLGIDEEFAARVETRVVDPTLSDEEAERQSEFVERLDDNGSQRHLVVLAPHGGAIERHTDYQAERVASTLGCEHASAWRCKGFKAGGGAFERWHITSTEIHEESFPQLKTIRDRGFAHAVAFHGFSSDGVLIGGGAPYLLKRIMAFAIDNALPGSGIAVRVATPADNYDGDNPDNLVNRLTVCGSHGVQIEQSAEARSRFGEQIADAVALVYRNVLLWPRLEEQSFLTSGLLETIASRAIGQWGVS